METHLFDILFDCIFEARSVLCCAMQNKDLRIFDVVVVFDQVFGLASNSQGGHWRLSLHLDAVATLVA